MLRPGVFLQDRYEILEKIGSGGMSDVYKAKCHKLNRLVAIKVLKEEFISDVNFVGKFKMEAQAAAGLSHPNIVNIYDVIDESTIHYIVMELIEGVTLKNYIAMKGKLEVKETTGIAIQVAQGIAAAHEQHIIHRDIKPQNMIISKDGKVKVADFGIARAVSEQTLNSNAMGSVHYISPEQARGGYSDERSDIYSLGITIYEMVTGRVPFQGANTVTVALAHLEEPVTPPSVFNPSITISLEKIILKCTEKRAENRYSSALEVISDLRRSMVEPDSDFIKPSLYMDHTSKTVTISPEELAQIKGGQKKTTIDYYQPVRQQKQRPQQSHPSKNQKKKSKHPDSDVNPQIEKLLSVAGVIVAIMIVAVLLFVFAKLGGIFNLGSGTKDSIEDTSVTQESSQVLSDKDVYMPKIEGLDEDAAEAKLKENNLVMKRAEPQYSDTVPEGCVLSQENKAGTIVAKYSNVYVVISKGSDKIDLTLLSLTDMTGEQAELLLKEKKLTVKLEQENHNTVEKGKIIRFTPEKAAEGDLVTLYVSMGSLANMTAVPQLEGQSEEIALGYLIDAQLVPGEATLGHSEAYPKGIVIGQDIPAGSQVEKGSKVSYVVSSGPEGSDQRYVASINDNYDLSNLVGPGSGSATVEVMIRLKQHVNGENVYKTLMPAQTLEGNKILPVNFTGIEGSPGIDTGDIEVVDVDSGAVLKSYPVTFFPQQ